MTAYLIQKLQLKIFDDDLWWHLANGRMMALSGKIIKEDVLSHTLTGTPWVNFEWLSQLFLYGLMDNLGIQSIYYGKIFMGCLIAGLVIGAFYLNGLRQAWLVFFSLLTIWVIHTRLFERVELVSLLLLTAHITVLGQFHRSEERRTKIYSAILFVLMVLWCNLHGGFVFGLGAHFLYLIGCRWSKLEKQAINALDRSFVMCCAAAFINPYGPKIADVFVEHLVQLFFGPTLIQEWNPLPITGNPGFWILFAIITSLVGLGITKNWSEAKQWAPLCLVFMIWGGRYSRNAAVAALAVVPALAVLWSQYFLYIQSNSRHPWRLPLLGWGCAWALIAFLVLPIKFTPPTGFLKANRFPTGACEFVKRHNIQGRMYNTYQYGGYIEWALGPDWKVFMDGRYIFHPLLAEHARMDFNLYNNPQTNEWPKFLQERGVDFAITQYMDLPIPSQGLAPFPFSQLNLLFPRSDWALVYWDDTALVFVKRLEKFQPLIASYEYTQLWPHNLAQMATLINLKKINLKKAHEELHRHADEVEFSITREQIRSLLT